MFLVYLNILAQAFAITDIMFNFGNFFTKKRHNFLIYRDTEIERIKLYVVGMKFFCASNADNYMSKSQSKPQLFSNLKKNCTFPKKY